MTSVCADRAAANASALPAFTITLQTTIVDISIRYDKPQTVLRGGEFAAWLNSSRNCCANVVYLSLTGQKEVHPGEFADIARRMPKLRVIDVSGTQVPPSAVLVFLAELPTLEKIHVAYNTWDHTLPGDEIACVAMMMVHGPERLVINESMPDLDEIELPDLGLEVAVKK